MSDFTPIVADVAERLRRRGVREIVYFHTDHFEPWNFSATRPPRLAAQEVADFVDAVGEVDFARRLTLFYKNALDAAFSREQKLIRAVESDLIGFIPRSEEEHDILGAPMRYMRSRAAHEIQVHVHHEHFTRTTALNNPRIASYLGSDDNAALDGARLECAVRQWFECARREFDFAPERWFFVHGMWSLNASDPEACTIEDEIDRLMALGCRGDFTFPSGRPHCDPRYEAPYFCTPVAGPKSYDTDAAEPAFAWGNRDAGDRFFIWNSPIKAGGSSLDWGEAAVRRRLEQPAGMASDIADRSFCWDGVLFVKTHAHSMHRMNRDGDGRLVHPHCHGPVRDLLGAIFGAADRAGAAITFATASEVYDRFVQAAAPETVPAMADFRPTVSGRDLPSIGPTETRIQRIAAAIDELATAAVTARVAAMGQDESGAEAHYATLAARGSVLPRHDIRAAQILLRLFGTHRPVHEIGTGIGTLPMLLAALGITATGIESSERRYAACRAVTAHIAAQWPGALASWDIIHGRFPFCMEDWVLSETVAVTTDIVGTMNLERRADFIAGLRRYGAALIELDRFIQRSQGEAARRALAAEFQAAGWPAIYDVDIGADAAFVLAVSNLSLLGATGTE